MSMPLTIIGNEYSDAWDEIINSLRDEHKKRLDSASKRLNGLFKSSIRMMPVAAVNAAVHKMQREHSMTHGQTMIDGLNQSSEYGGNNSNSEGQNADAELQKHEHMFDRMKIVELMTERMQSAYNQLLQRSAMLEAHRRVIPLLEKCISETQKSARLTPMLLMYITELRGWMVTLRTGSSFVIDQLTKDQASKQPGANMKAKRLSIIGVGPKPAENTDDEDDAGSQNHRKSSGKSNLGSLDENEGHSDDDDGDNAINDDYDPSLSVPFMQLVADSIFGKKSSRHESERAIMMAKLAKDPTNFRLRMWHMMAVHNTSRQARAYQLLNLSLILVSVLLLFTETLASWNNWGPSSPLCGDVLAKYCVDKHSNVLDPGCYVIDTTSGNATDAKLRFQCTDYDCFGYGMNWGSPYTNLTCPSDPMTESYPFQSQVKLTYTYGKPIMFTSRPKMHRLSAVCLRMECNPPANSLSNSQQVDGPPIFFICEVFITILFSMDVCMRIAVADSVMRYFSSAMNIFDLFAIFPFFVEVSGLDGHDATFGIISSSPENYFLVLARAFKVVWRPQAADVV
jgi:hypothetical protein